MGDIPSSIQSLLSCKFTWSLLGRSSQDRELESKDFNAVSKSFVDKGGYGKTKLSRYDLNWNDTFYAAFDKGTCERNQLVHR